MRRSFACLLVALMPLLSHAAPAELRQVFKGRTPYSETDYTYLWMDVYRIALWTDEAVWKPASRYALSITYQMDFTADELVERTCDEMQRHRADGKALCLQREDRLKQLMPQVKKGDRITALHMPDGTTRFYKNGARTGDLHDAAFSEAFFAIWLGENTSDPSLRARLLEKQ